MSEEGRGPGMEPSALDVSLSEVCRLLDSLRGRLDRLEAGTGLPGREPAVGSGPHALDLFQEVLSIPASAPDPGELFALALDRVSRLLGVDRVMLLVAEGPGGPLRPRSGRGFRRDDLESIAVEPSEGLVGRVFKERRVLAYPRDLEGAADRFIERCPVREAIAAPVRAEADVAGVLYAGRRELGVPFGPSEIVVLLAVADRVGAALVQEGLLARRTSHLAQLRELAAFAGEMFGEGDGERLLQGACQAAARLLGVRVAAAALFAEGGELAVRAAAGLAGEPQGRRMAADGGLTGEALASLAPVACRDLLARRDAAPAFLAEAGLRACLLVPLRAGGRPLGVLYLAEPGTRDWAAEEVEAARLLGALTGVALESGRLHAEAREALEGLRGGHERLADLEKARVLGAMAAGITREFNNIFAVILGKSQLLLARTHDEPLREGLGVLEEAAWRGADIVHRLVGLAAAAADDASALVSMTALVEDALALTRARWKDEPEGRGVRIEVVSELAAAPAVRANPTALREVVTNLILNAVDAMPGGGRLLLRARRSAGRTELSVEDTGEGMTPEVRQRIFEPFFTTRGHQRLGLGLAVVHGIVARLGGRLEVQSEPGRGTTVTLRLPGVEVQPAGAGGEGPARAGGAARSEDAAAAAAGLEGPDAEAPCPAASILVLAEEAQIRASLCEALGEAGHRVDAASDGLDGLERFERQRVDLVVADLSLPRRSGLEVARGVKALSPTTPVVLITGWGKLLDSQRLKESGVDLVLVKPFRLERVLAVVGEALRLSRSA